VSGLLQSFTRRSRALLPRRRDLEEMRRDPRRDVLAGVTVGIVALPLALAFGITSGLGATAGLVTAIVAGAAAAAFGGSNLQVSGPTGAMTVVLIPLVASYGAEGVLVVGLMAGVALIVMAYAGLGRYVRLIPLPVIEGFTLGIALIIGLQQLPSALGVQVEGEHVLRLAGDAVVAWFRSPTAAAPLVGLAVVATMLLTSRLRPGVPGSLVGVAVVTVVAELLHLDVARIGALPSGLPAPGMPEVPWASLHYLVLPALAVAALAALESLLSATVADAMSVSERHDPDRELLGQGVANLAAPLFGGIPATAAIARTAVNVRSGASSRLAALVHAAVLLLVVLLLAPLVERIPLAALAGVLLVTALRMVEVSSVRALVRTSRGDALVLLGTATATLLLDLVTAVLLGVVAAGAVALRRLAGSVSLEEEPLPLEGHDAEERALLDAHIVAFRLDGPLFFGAAHQALLELSTVTDTKVVILRMSRAASLDTTGAALLRDTVRDLEHRGTTVLVSGVRPEHRALLDGLAFKEGRHLFARTPDAIAHARSLVDGTPAPLAPCGPDDGQPDSAWTSVSWR
jgi:SulP family sulfate permease